MRRAIIFGSSVAAILALAYLWPSFGGSSVENGGARGAMCIAGHCCCAGRAEAETVAANAAQERLTLDPNQFTGPVKQAYKVAEKNPALLAELHCYCGCDKARRSSESARLLSRPPWRDLRNLHRGGLAGGSDVGAAFAGRSDTRRDPQAVRSRQLNRTGKPICGAVFFNHNPFDAVECRSAAAA